jgi:hypothetical protein
VARETRFAIERAVALAAEPGATMTDALAVPVRVVETAKSRCTNSLPGHLAGRPLLQRLDAGTSGTEQRGLAGAGVSRATQRDADRAASVAETGAGAAIGVERPDQRHAAGPGGLGSGERRPAFRSVDGKQGSAVYIAGRVPHQRREAPRGRLDVDGERLPVGRPIRHALPAGGPHTYFVGPGRDPTACEGSFAVGGRIQGTDVRQLFLDRASAGATAAGTAVSRVVSLAAGGVPARAARRNRSHCGQRHRDQAGFRSGPAQARESAIRCDHGHPRFPGQMRAVPPAGRGQVGRDRTPSPAAFLPPAPSSPHARLRMRWVHPTPRARPGRVRDDSCVALA